MNDITRSHSSASEGPKRLDQTENGVYHRHVRAGDITLHYVERGEGKPVLLIPGWPQSWYAWRRVIPLLASRGRRVIAVDPRGLGDSDRPEQGYDLATVAADLHQMVVQLGLLSTGPLDVAGHDVGAWIAYAWAADWRQDVRRLALYEAALPGITPPAPHGIPSEVANSRTWHFAFNRLAGLPEHLVAGRERLYLDWIFRAKLRNRSAITDADLDEYTRVFSAPGAAHAGFEYYRMLFNGDGMERNRRRAQHRLTIPVMAWGASDGVGEKLLRTMEQVADKVSGGVIESCGHYVPEEAPDVVAQQLTAFFGD
jgi:pimeloyl-ACP methyl ester carboxylesterase